MKKYWVAFLMNLKEHMQQRASLLMERVRSLSLILSLYFLWDSLLAEGQKEFLGYSRPQMITYVLGLALLRAFVLTNRAFELTWEIARGRLSALLMRPLNLFLYQFSIGLSDKLIRLASAAVEVTVLITVFQATLYLPAHWQSLFLAVLASVLALILYYFIGLALASSGFWSAESIGFLWAASLLMEFASGAFFPLDVLPRPAFEFLMALPFPYLIYFPINIYLERLGTDEILRGLLIQTAWIGGAWTIARWFWRRGLALFQAEGG